MIAPLPLLKSPRASFQRMPALCELPPFTE
jgi:hypothetical protein